MGKRFVWILFAVAAFTCIVWIGTGVRDDMREDVVYRDTIVRRMEIARHSDEVHVGVAGDWKRFRNILQGVRLAADDINEAGGILGRKIVLEVEDDNGTEEGALNVAQKLSNRPEVAFVVGHTSEPMNEVTTANYEFYQMFHISPNTASEHASQQHHSLAFENGMPPDEVGTFVLELAQRKGWRRLGIIYDQEEATTHRARRFEALAEKTGIEISFSFGFTQSQTDIKADMARWKREEDVDAYLFAVSREQMPPFVRAARAIGINEPIVIFGPAPPPGWVERISPDAPMYFFTDKDSVPLPKSLRLFSRRIRPRRQRWTMPSVTMPCGCSLRRSPRRSRSFRPTSLPCSGGIPLTCLIQGPCRLTSMGQRSSGHIRMAGSTSFLSRVWTSLPQSALLCYPESKKGDVPCQPKSDTPPVSKPVLKPM